MNLALQSYLESAGTNVDEGAISYIANLSQIAKVNPKISSSIVNELKAQRSSLKLIASENYCSLATQAAMGNLLTDKYAEGFPLHRFYAGCDNVDDIELEASKQAQELFGCDYAYVQPHSGADANMIAFLSVLHARVGGSVLEELKKEKMTELSVEEFARYREALGSQKLLGLDYYSGGHLTHGYRFNISAQLFEAHSYSVREDTWLLDYDQIREQAKSIRPILLLAGYSAYPRSLDFAALRSIADEVGAVLMVDMAHFAGLVAGKVFSGNENPIPHAHIVTSTTHKTLRGPRGGIVLCQEEFAEYVNKGCPYVIGGPLPHVMAAKAVAFTEANKPEFSKYASKVVENSRALAAACLDEGIPVATDGTDNHLCLLDVRPFGLTGRQAEAALRECGITLNRNSLPFDPHGAWFTSGLRVGTPAVTTLGMGVEEMKEIAAVISMVLKATQAAMLPPKNGEEAKPSRGKFLLDDRVKTEAQKRVDTLLSRFVLYPELDLEMLEKNFLK